MTANVRARARFKNMSRGGALLFATLVATPSALAQATTPPTTCIAGPATVPGLEGPPNWVGTLASPDFPAGARLDIDEPRWAGAPLLPFAAAIASGAPSYRILKDSNYVYLSFHVPTETVGPNAVYFAFSEVFAPTSKAYALSISPAPAGTTGDPILLDPGEHHVFETATGWRPVGAKPVWLDRVATWRNTTATGLAFGVNFRIALKTASNPNGVSMGKVGQFRAFFAVRQGLGSAGTATYTSLPVTATDPKVPGTPVPTDRAKWLTFMPLAAPCIEGVTLDSYNIRTTHPDGCSLFTGPPNPMPNSFTIEPQRVGNIVPLPNELLRAKIELSDWGAAVNDSQAAWTVVPGTNTEPPTGGTWSWAWNPPPTASSVGAAAIGFTCNPATAPYCPQLTTALSAAEASSDAASQSILVTLSPNPNAPGSHLVRFKRASALLSMAFVGLSEFSRAATISLKGSGKGTGSRDVFLKVVRRNMPPHDDEVRKLPLDEMHRVVRFVRNPPPSPLGPASDVPEPGDVPGVQTKAAAAPPAPQAKPSQDPPKVDGLAPIPYPLPLEYSSATQHELLSRVWPVYEVHAYYDTGETIVQDGKRQKVLKELTPFGYLLSHTGPFYGFSDSIEGLGTKLTQVEPDLYRVTVPDDGAIRIRTTIRAEEKPKTKCCNQAPPQVNIRLRGCYCRAPGAGAGDPRLLPLALLPFAVFWIRRRQRRAAHR